MEKNIQSSGTFFNSQKTLTAYSIACYKNAYMRSDEGEYFCGAHIISACRGDVHHLLVGGSQSVGNNRWETPRNSSRHASGSDARLIWLVYHAEK
jgi:hypothetical protein